MIDQRSAEVFQATGDVVRVMARDLEAVLHAAKSSSRKRARICSHPTSADSLHEMLIVLDHRTIIRPHRHAGKSESFHMIQGELAVVLFSESGSIVDVIEMGPLGSGKTFYYRLNAAIYHTVLVRSEQVLFHETTNGPFVAEQTEFAPWAPDTQDNTWLQEQIRNWQADTTRSTS
jgi:cupin fold WbuC family metalloprotein